MTDLLNRCREERKMCSIFRDREEKDRHMTGFVECFNESEVIVASVTPYGCYDGFIWFYRDAMFRIDCGGKYENMLEKLYGHRNQVHPRIDVVDNENSLMLNILDFAIENDLIITVAFEDTYFTGSPKSYNDEYLFVEGYNEFGEFDGERCISFPEILSLTVDDEECLSINILRKMK